MKRKGGMPAPIVLRRNKVMFEELAGMRLDTRTSINGAPGMIGGG
jgi:hypothetical protein